MVSTFELPPRAHPQLAFSESFGVLCFHQPPEGEAGKARLGLLESGESIPLSENNDMGAAMIATHRDYVALSFTDIMGAPKAILIGRLTSGANSPVLGETVRIARGAWEMTFDDRGEKIACTNLSRGLWTYDAQSGESLGFLRADSFLCSSSFEPGGRSLVILGTDGRLRAWRVGEETIYAEIALEGFGESLAASPDGAVLAVRTAKEIALVRRDPLSTIWRTPPTRSSSDGSAPNARIGWIDDEHFLVPWSESAPEGPYVCRTETFFYLFSRSASIIRARIRAPDWCKLVTDPIRRSILVTDDTTIWLHTLDSLLG
jgi:hypothetical protein